MKKSIFSIFALSSLGLLAFTAINELPIGADMPKADVKMKDISGNQISLKDAAKNNIYAPIIFLDETNADLFCPIVDPKWSGAIPASLFLNNKTGYRKFFEDQLTKDQLEKKIIFMIQPK